MFIRSTGEPVLAQVVGHSEHGDAYRRITYDCDGKTILHDRASVRRLSLPGAPSPPRPALGVWSPRGGWGTVFPGVGNDKGGGGYVHCGQPVYTVDESYVLCATCLPPLLVGMNSLVQACDLRRRLMAPCHARQAACAPALICIFFAFQ